MRYEGIVYRPPSEANSLLIQATIGCPHNRCTFCSLYKGTKFRIRKIEDIKADLKAALHYYGPNVRSIFFPDGNTIYMKTSQLVEILSYARSLFPFVQRMTVYGSARFVILKSQAELIELKNAGLSRVHMGMESGDDEVLQRINKGCTAADIIAAGKALQAAGIEVSEYFLVGIGGKERTREHAINSARVISAFSPEFVRLRTFSSIPGTPLDDSIKAGSFQVLSAHELLQEIRLLIENLECQGTAIVSDHVSNLIDIKGFLPQDQQMMLKAIDRGLAIDESKYIRPDITML